MSEDGNNYTALPDGSLLYDKPLFINNPHWTLDPENGRRVIPVVPTCTARKIALRTLGCGRRRATWSCSVLNRVVTVVDCNGCEKCPS